MQVTLWARMPSQVFLVSPFSFCSAGSHVSWHPKLPVCVPFLRGSVSFEGREPETWTKDVLVKGLLGALPQRVSELCPGGHQLLQCLL